VADDNVSPLADEEAGQETVPRYGQAAPADGE
jgi:hypothetical protein